MERQAAADNATTWHLQISGLTGTTPWMTLAVAEADAEAGYFTALVIPSTTSQTALAAAEKDCAKPLSRGKFIGGVAQFALQNRA